MNDQLHDLIGAYAVDALEPEERLAFERHLGTCASCQDELAGLGDALAELSADYETAPPATLRAAVLDAVAKSSGTTEAESSDGLAAPDVAEAPARAAEAPSVEAERDVPPRRAIEETGAPVADQTDADAGDETAIAPVTPLRPPPANRGRWQLLVAAAIVLIAVIGISVWQPWVQRTVTAADVLAAPDAVRGTTTIDGASVTLVRSNQLGKAVLITHNMPPAPSGKAHQAWLQQPSGTMVSGGMMPAGADVTMLLEGDARDTVGAGISVEPPGGSPQPNPDGAILVKL